MKVLFAVLVCGLVAGGCGRVVAQSDSGPAVQPQSTAQSAGGGQGQRGFRGGGMGGWGGRGMMGTVTAVAADHYTIKTDAGETWTVQVGVNTRILHQTARRDGQGGRGEGGELPQSLKISDIKVGDAISVMGESDSAKKSLGAAFVLQLEPEVAQKIREMQANFGKTWLMGSVTAITGVTVKIDSQVDGAAHTFTADENTTFRQRREPVTLGDVKVGDMVRVEGAVKNDVFVAARVNVMSPGSQGGPPMVPRDGPPPAPPQQQ